MKYILSLLVCFFSISIYAQNVNIPDANFKTYLLTNTDVNTNNDSEIQLTEATAFTGSLAFQFWSINSLIGIEAFTNLTFLDCGDNNLTSLDLSQNTALEQLYCYDNNLTSLDLSANTALIELDCRDNQILELDLSNNPNLNYLQCPFNGMTSLNVANTAMQIIRAYSNALTSLILTNTETTLTTLLVYNNNITELELSDYSALEIFECGNSSSLTSVNIANSNNTSITSFSSLNTPNLDCIQVDDEVYSSTNWTNVDGTTAFSEDCSSLSVEDFNAVSIKYYPNPVNNELYLDLFENMEYEIISLKGQVLEYGNLLKGINTINVSSLSQGIYIIHGTTINGKSISTRFVKN